MRRWNHIASAILGAYAGSEATFTEAGSRYAYEGGTNRIVAYPIDGVIEEPDISGGDALLEEDEPSAIHAASGAVDDILFARRVNVAFEIWAPDNDAGEDRLHALLVAISSVLNTTLQLSNLREQWPQSRGDLTSGGAMVVLYLTLTFYVMRSDAQVSSGAPIGAGTPLSQMTSTEIDPSLNDEALPPATEELT